MCSLSINYMLGIGKTPEDSEKDMHNQSSQFRILHRWNRVRVKYFPHPGAEQATCSPTDVHTKTVMQLRSPLLAFIPFPP